MAAAAAYQTFERVLHLVVGRVRMLVQQCRRCEDPSIQAVSALKRLLFNESLLHRMRILRRSQSVQRDDFLTHGPRNRKHARSRGDLVHQDHTGTALSQAATKSRIV